MRIQWDSKKVHWRKYSNYDFCFLRANTQTYKCTWNEIGYDLDRTLSGWKMNANSHGCLWFCGVSPCFTIEDAHIAQHWMFFAVSPIALHSIQTSKLLNVRLQFYWIVWAIEDRKQTDEHKECDSIGFV